jgi:hypothetical protein
VRFVKSCFAGIPDGFARKSSGLDGPALSTKETRTRTPWTALQWVDTEWCFDFEGDVRKPLHISEDAELGPDATGLGFASQLSYVRSGQAQLHEAFGIPFPGGT